MPTNIRFRDGSYSNFNNTDLNGNAGFNEVFPLFSWYVIETDSTRYKNTGIHVVYDAGGPADGTTLLPSRAETPAIARTSWRTPSRPVLCAAPNSAGAGRGLLRQRGLHRRSRSAERPGQQRHVGLSTGRIDPPWVSTEGWQGFSGQNNFLEFGKKPFAAGENGGIQGEVVYASTRPFDDPPLLLQTSWKPDWSRMSPSTSTRKGPRPDGSTSP